MKRKSIAVAQYLDHKLLHVYENARLAGSSVDGNHHIDRDKENNRLVNLRWATAMEQAKNQKSKQKIPTLSYLLL